MIIPKFFRFKMMEKSGENFRSGVSRFDSETCHFECGVCPFDNEACHFECGVCPFECGVDRVGRMGVCGLPNKILVSHVQRHFYEEPFISGNACGGGLLTISDDMRYDSADTGAVAEGGGSGTVFFTGCNARCVFCQNYKISQKDEWLRRNKREVSNKELFEICRGLVDKGAHNINFVSPTPYSHLLKDFLVKYKDRIGVPVIWNSNGYEKASVIAELDGLVDVYLPDLKYFDNDLAVRCSSLPKYFEFASEAVAEMLRQVGWPEIGDDGFIKRGLVIRHLVLPGCLDDSKRVLRWIRDEFGPEAYVALMSQYYPTYKACGMPDLSRGLTEDEHMEIIEYFEGLGFNDGLIQDLDSADEIYTPDFM